MTVSIILIITIAICALLSIVAPIAMGIYTYRDAKSRGMDAAAWTVLVVLVGLIGLIIYLISRKNSTGLSCPRCENDVEPSYMICPKCGQPLRSLCTNCSAPVDPDWKLCPHCGTELPEDTKQNAPVVKKRKKDTGLIVAAVIFMVVPLLIMIVCSFAVLFLSVTQDGGYSEESYYHEETGPKVYSYSIMVGDDNDLVGVVEAELTTYSELDLTEAQYNALNVSDSDAIHYIKYDEHSVTPADGSEEWSVFYETYVFSLSESAPWILDTVSATYADEAYTTLDYNFVLSKDSDYDNSELLMVTIAKDVTSSEGYPAAIFEKIKSITVEELNGESATLNFDANPTHTIFFEGNAKDLEDAIVVSPESTKYYDFAWHDFSESELDYFVATNSGKLKSLDCGTFDAVGYFDDGNYRLTCHRYLVALDKAGDFGTNVNATVENEVTVEVDEIENADEYWSDMVVIDVVESISDGNGNVVKEFAPLEKLTVVADNKSATLIS